MKCIAWGRIVWLMGKKIQKTKLKSDGEFKEEVNKSTKVKINNSATISLPKVQLFGSLYFLKMKWNVKYEIPAISE